METLKIKLFQPTAQYTEGVGSKEARNSYPLPPYSTVIGMLHALAGFTKYHPMKVSIVGKTDNQVIDFERGINVVKAGYIESPWNPAKSAKTLYEYQMYHLQTKSNGYALVEQPLSEKEIKDGSKHKYSTLMPKVTKQKLMTGVALTIHVQPEDEADLATLYEAVRHPKTFAYLGRSEDLVLIQDVRLVNLRVEEELDIKDLKDADRLSELACWLPFELYQHIDDDQIRGTVFNLTHDYHVEATVDNGSVRIWNYVDAMYYKGLDDFDDETVTVDSDGDLVFLA